MGWAGQQWLRFTQEGTGGTNYGTFNGSAISSQILYATLVGGDPFTPRLGPQRQLIRTADAGNRRKFVVAHKQGIAGRLSTILHPDQAAYWVTAATSLSSGRLPSYTADYWDSVRAQRFLGGTLRSITITSSADQDYVTANMDWVFQRRDDTFTSFAQPSESNYSALVPYAHVETASNFTLGGTAITAYRTSSITLNNVIATPFNENTYISAAYYCGRDLDIQVGPEYVATAYRGDYENQTALSFVLEWARSSPAHTLTFDLKTNSYLASVEDSLPLDGVGYQNLVVQCFFDAANSTDFAVTAS